MQVTQAGMLKSLRAVKDFIDAYIGRLGDVGIYRQRLDDAIVALDAHATTQSGSTLDAKSSTQRQRTLETQLLRDHMAPIAQIAQAELPHTPELLPLRMPKRGLGPERLVQAARGMADTAAKYPDVFIAGGRPADFANRLRDAAGAILIPISVRTTSNGTRSGATTGLKKKLAEGRNTVKVIDVLVKSALRDDAELLSHWRTVKKVPALPAAHAAPGAEAPASTTAVVPAPAATGSTTGSKAA